MNIHECGGDLWDAFLRDLVEHPDDLTPRLILADWLEEQGHPIQKARAEFIRLQYEGTDKAMRQAGRMLELCFPQWWLPTWAPLERIHRLPGRIWKKSMTQYYHIEPNNKGGLTVQLHGPGGLSVTFRRGFVEELRLPLSMLEQYVGRLFTTCPLRKVGLTDRHPMEADRLGWCWYDQDTIPVLPSNWPDDAETAALPSPIFVRLPSSRTHPKGRRWPLIEHVAHGYADADEARDACSRAILAWGRELQGMATAQA